MSDWLSFLPFVAIVIAAASTGAVFSPGPWYVALNKPSWTPPDWAFPVVWTLLYAMIAVAGWQVWSRDGFGLALAIWGLNLVLNAAWSWIMFGRQQIKLALMDALGMLLTTAAFIVVAWPISVAAAALFVPYLAWVAAAVVLNYQVWRLNPEPVGADAQGP
ncbi:MAG: TspO/MBR family protein [Pseudomonadota bacterium]